MATAVVGSGSQFARLSLHRVCSAAGEHSTLESDHDDLVSDAVLSAPPAAAGGVAGPAVAVNTSPPSQRRIPAAASEIAKTVGNVALNASMYLDSHPQTNRGADGGRRAAGRAAVRGGAEGPTSTLNPQAT